MCAGRRRLFSTAVATIGMAQLGIATSTHAQASETDVERHSATRLRTMSSFAPLKQIDAGVLNIRYAEAGPADGLPREPKSKI
jgi:hypothetical protein